MEEDKALAWLGRKIGWGFTPGQFDAWSRMGVERVIDRLVEPEDHAVPGRGDRFEGVDRSDDRSQRMARLATLGWIENAVTSPRPLETFMEFFWSDFFGVSFRVVRPRNLMLPYMNRLARLSLGNFANLLRAISREPAMLDFLDGGRNTQKSPNENYARELLELYSVGVGNFDEDDVYAASRALTGWHLDRETGNVEFRPDDHDDSHQELLGASEVNNLFNVVTAAVEHPATAPRIVGLLAQAILGPDYDERLTTRLVENFADDMEIKPVVRGLLELGVQGHATESVLEPLAWYVTARRFPMDKPTERALRVYFEQSGQPPLFPPNVGGYPAPSSYLSTSATIARLNMATHLVDRSFGPIVGRDFVRTTRNLDELAWSLGLLEGFAPATKTALGRLNPGIDRMAAAMACPDLVVV